MKKLCFTTTALLAVAGMSHAASLTDTTPGTATNDGTVNGGEYATTFSGAGTGFGDVIGASGSLGIDSDTAGNLNFGLSTGPGAFNDVAVIYLDTGSGSGVTSTTAIAPADFSLGGTATARLTSAISGNGEFENSSELDFAPGFNADYAIAVSSNFGIVEAALFSISAAGTLAEVTDANLTSLAGDPSSQFLEFDITLGDLGLSSGDSFDFFATYLNNGNAFRSDEFIGVPSLAGSGNIGNGVTTALSTGDFDTFTSVIPEPASLALLSVGGLFLCGRRRRTA